MCHGVREEGLAGIFQMKFTTAVLTDQALSVVFAASARAASLSVGMGS